VRRLKPPEPVRFALALLALALLIATAGCRRYKPTSSVVTRDPRAASQLVSGFYQIENRAWRWTQQKFAVSLVSPPGANVTGAHLVARITVPEVLLQRFPSVALSAQVSGYPLSEDVYTTPGNHDYTRDVPASYLVDKNVRVDFSLDKSLPPGPVDRRELGIIVREIGLVTNQ